MSTKYFCDVCGAEMSRTVRVRGLRGVLCFEITTGFRGQDLRTVWNEGHFCRACILQAINQPELLDGRPKIP